MEELIGFILNNFWLIMLIMTLLSLKDHRICGFLLLGFHIIFGANPFTIGVIIVISLVIEIIKKSNNHQKVLCIRENLHYTDSTSQGNSTKNNQK